MLYAILSIPISYLVLRGRLKKFDLFITIEVIFFVVLAVYLLWREGGFNMKNLVKKVLYVVAFNLLVFATFATFAALPSNFSMLTGQMGINTASYCYSNCV